MSEGHLLACACGAAHVVKVQQAGERIRCECGQQLDIPSMRVIRNLPSAAGKGPPPAGRRPPNWTIGRGIVFATGTAVAPISFAAIGRFTWSLSQLNTDRPSLADLNYRRDLVDLSPSETWDAWTELFRGQPLGARLIPTHVQHQAMVRTYRWFAGIAALFAVGGTVTAGAALFVNNRGP